MNKRQVIVLWVIAFVLAAAVVVLKVSSGDGAKNETDRAAGETLLEGFPLAEVAEMTISGVDGTFTLKKSDAGWMVAERDDYAARTAVIHDFLRSLAELKVTRGIEAGPSFAPRFGMDPDASEEAERGITVEFKDSSGADVAKISFGKNIESGSDSGLMGGGMTVGRYVWNHADTSGFYAVSEMFPSLTTEVSAWLNSEFFNPEKIKSVSLTEPGSDKVSWEVVRETEEAEFKLADAAPGEVVDPSAVSPLKSLFSYARFDDVMPAADAKEAINESVLRVASIETFEGFQYRVVMSPIENESEKVLITIEVNAKIPEERKKEEGETDEVAKTKDAALATRSKALKDKLEKEKKLEGRTYIVTKATVNPVMKERANIIKKAEVPEPGAGAPASVSEAPGGVIATPPIRAGGPVEVPAPAPTNPGDE